MTDALLDLLSAVWLATAPVQACEVSHCHDGDTCTLICQGEKTKVRLHCIDAPEMEQGRWGRESRDVLRNRLPKGSTVELQRVDTDKYGRVVGVLLENQVNINLQMVYRGWAATYPEHCKELDYYQAQQDAKDGRRGIWRTNGLHQRPWVWRKAQGR
jgi:endonuclease YncB( thermonuclease family)